MSRVFSEPRRPGDQSSLTCARRILAWRRGEAPPCGHAEPFGTIVGCSVNEEQAVRLAESGAANELVQASSMLFQVFGAHYGHDVGRA